MTMRKLLFVVVLMLSSVCLTAATQQFGVRALHIDLRTQVMTMDALKLTADKAAAASMNTIIMEWEANFPFQDNATICGKIAYTRAEVSDFIKYCGQKGLDVIPLQNCFGHSEYILRHERYASLRESDKDFSQVCPSRIKQCCKVFESIFAEIAAMHPSKYIHIGADETRLLGVCKRCNDKSNSDLFVDYVSAMCAIVKRLGKTPIIWADMLLKHPEAADRLPKDLIVLDWNYGWKTDHFGDIDGLLAKGFEMWGACALRSSPDDVKTTCWNVHLGNLQDYVDFCRKKGFTGLVETSWSTSGTYGYLLGHKETFDLQPIREVYPLCGFDLLVAAFGRAANSGERLDAHAFVRDFCKEKFGLKDSELEVMERYFFTPQNTPNVYVNKPSDFQKEADVVKGLRRQMGNVSPRKGKALWNHLALMLDIRANYMAYKVVESVTEQPDFHASVAPRLLKQLEPLVKESQALKKRFVKLNKSFLKVPEMPLGDWSYVKKMNDLYVKLQALS